MNELTMVWLVIENYPWDGLTSVASVWSTLELAEAKAARRGNRFEVEEWLVNDADGRRDDD